MQIFINNPVQQTILFCIVLGIVFIFTFGKKQEYSPLSLTQELKGFAILTIIFGHVGYFLFENKEFLFPLSVLSGVGVNLFFFLSGYGITFSQMKRDEGIFAFYKRRLIKLFVPFWIVLGILLLTDFLILGKVYAFDFVLKAVFGIFTQANMSVDFNSPLWYFSLIFLYYVLFPIFFNKKRPWVTALLLYGVVWLLVYMDPPSFSGVIGLYEVHTLAFPLGVLCAWGIGREKNILNSFKTFYIKYEQYLYPLLMLGLLGSIGYFAIHSNVGDLAYIEQATSLLLLFLIVLLFVFKKRESKLLSLFGLYSYEIYLFHWPLLSQYDFLYRNIPAWIATVLYLGIFVLLGVFLKKMTSLVRA